MNKKYKVEVKTERNGKDIYLSVTHNGYQWASIAIKEPEIEIPLIISALRHYLTSIMHSDGEGRCNCPIQGLTVFHKPECEYYE